MKGIGDLKVNFLKKNKKMSFKNFYIHKKSLARILV